MAEELKACPCCGNSEITDSESYIMCMVCGLMIDRCDAPGNDYVKAWNTRAQLPSQGGEAVAWRVTGRDGLTVTAQYPEWAEADCLLTITPLYTHPADQVADDLTMVKVSRELLERIIKRGMRLPDETQHQHLEELRAILEVKP